MSVLLDSVTLSFALVLLLVSSILFSLVCQAYCTVEVVRKAEMWDRGFLNFIAIASYFARPHLQCKSQLFLSESPGISVFPAKPEFK